VVPELPPSLRGALSGGRYLAYELRLGDRLLGRHWARLTETSDDGYVFQLISELTPVLPAGGSAKVIAAVLRTEGSLLPYELTVTSDQRTLRITLSAGIAHIRLPDGTSTEVEADGVQGLLEHQLPFLHTVLLADPSERRRPTRRVLLVQQLLPISYVLTAHPGNVVTTSLGERITLDPDGLMTSLEVTSQAFTASLVPLAEPPVAAGRPEKARPTYRPPTGAHFLQRDVAVPGPVVSLGATLTIPRGTRPWPAVLFVAGSGSADRHGIAGEIDTGVHEIVDGLSEAGFVGVRYDPRGIGQTKAGADLLDRGFDARVADARAILSYLQDRPEVDPGRTAVIGHSEGGVIALVLAAEGEPSPRAVALLACPGRPLDALIEDQISWQARELALDDTVRDAQLTRFREFTARVRAGGDWQENEVPAEIYASMRQRRWFGELLAQEPTALIARSRSAVLVAQGTADRQVSVEADAEPLATAAWAAGKSCELKIYPGLDHLFKSAEGRPALGDYALRRAVSGRLIHDLATWLRSL
jgi:alpha-beta hydrolase superfamily lysophospholipase